MSGFAWCRGFPCFGDFTVGLRVEPLPCAAGVLGLDVVVLGAGAEAAGAADFETEMIGSDGAGAGIPGFAGAAAAGAAGAGCWAGGQGMKISGGAKWMAPGAGTEPG